MEQSVARFPPPFAQARPQSATATGRRAYRVDPGPCLCTDHRQVQGECAPAQQTSGAERCALSPRRAARGLWAGGVPLGVCGSEPVCAPATPSPGPLPCLTTNVETGIRGYHFPLFVKRCLQAAIVSIQPFLVTLQLLGSV